MSITIEVRDGVRVVHLRGPVEDPLTEQVARGSLITPWYGKPSDHDSRHAIRAKDSRDEHGHKQRSPSSQRNRE